MAGRLADDDPQQALAHARAARRLGGRLALVREGAGITAYLAGEWAEALNELRAARRISGDNNLLHVIADCERALGRPERALDIARGPEVAGLPVELKVEMAIVEAGARRDMGQFDAAVLVLQSVPGASLSADTTQDWTPRLWYAYADSLAAAGRQEEAVRWFAATRDIDEDEITDAAERLAELGGSPTDALTVVDPSAEEPAIDGVENVEASAGPSGRDVPAVSPEPYQSDVDGPEVSQEASDQDVPAVSPDVSEQGVTAVSSDGPGSEPDAGDPPHDSAAETDGLEISFIEAVPADGDVDGAEDAPDQLGRSEDAGSEDGESEDAESEDAGSAHAGSEEAAEADREGAADLRQIESRHVDDPSDGTV